nr:unnamed protein product [Callosobruchus analis]
MQQSFIMMDRRVKKV